MCLRVYYFQFYPEQLPIQKDLDSTHMQNQFFAVF